MEIEICKEIPGLTAKSSMMFAYPTSLADVWFPASEQVLLPEEYIAPTKVRVKVFTGSTGPRRIGSWSWKAYRATTNLLRNRKKLDYSGKFIFDARYDTDENPAHFFDSLTSPILFARKVLSEHFQKDIDIHIVLRARTSKFARDAYHLLNIPIISTDDDVCGEIVTVSERDLFSIKSQLFNLNFPGCQDLGVERIFIPRRGTRRLINNDEVAQFLAERGFKTCYFEDFPLSQQWSIARYAKIVVAVHGAGVSNLHFNRLGLSPDSKPNSGVKVVELMSPSWNQRRCFRYLVNVINGQWCSVRGQITPQMLRGVDFFKGNPDCVKSPFKDPFKVDCQTIEMALDYLDKEQSNHNFDFHQPR
ncbi:DUF563 domain-containing protein [Scytonema sp. UIC 10036]|uniref:glycosyltransferase family 61 protein n=1 Tax=Scytonema sp. UIC 10036 TaxID=2304196 RepID=UPI0012DAD7F0|nr:glycosyltransferase family 61 protein [Scytonema sp. UIC 10036]MUG99984.1 DUF563 domain-containing protein [Scytonema sp. UIC 10036]